VNGPNPSPWRSRWWSMSIAVLGSAIAIYLAAELIRAVLPVLIIIGSLLIGTYLIRLLHHRHDGW